MKIVIVGDGKFGYALAESLSQEGHDITIVDRDDRALNKASETLDVMCVRGNAANARVLKEAGADACDIFIAVAASDETNMLCCLMCKQLGGKYTISRIRDPEYTESLSLLQREMGIDMVINPERGTAYEISRLFRYPYATNIETFAHGRVEMVEFRVEESDGIHGVPLRSLHSRVPGVLFCAAERGHDPIIPSGNFVIEPGDRLYVVGDLISVTRFFKKVGRNTQRVRSAILIGGGHISYYLARICTGMGMDLRIIEINPAKCTRLSEQLKGVTVLQGDGTEQELLLSENLRDMDSLVCLTDRDEENIMTGLFGRKLGIGKVIVKVTRMNYVDLLGELGVESAVSPKKTTVDTILRQVRALSHSQDSVVEKVYRIMDGRVEALEFTAAEEGAYLNTPLSELPLKPGVLVAVLVRGRRIIIPTGADHIEAGDTVILITRSSSIGSLDDALQNT